MTLPRIPGETREKKQTALGAVGMELNGIPLYNDFEGGGVLAESALYSIIYFDIIYQTDS